MLFWLRFFSMIAALKRQQQAKMEKCLTLQDFSEKTKHGSRDTKVIPSQAANSVTASGTIIKQQSGKHLFRQKKS